MKRYPNELLDMQYFEGFNKMYEKLLPDMGQKEAYEATEEIFYKWFNRYKYSSYESFRVIRAGYLKEKRK